MSENDSNEAWLATEDPTNGELPATEFIGSKKDLEQIVEPQEGDGGDIAEAPAERETETEAGE